MQLRGVFGAGTGGFQAVRRQITLPPHRRTISTTTEVCYISASMRVSTPPIEPIYHSRNVAFSCATPLSLRFQKDSHYAGPAPDLPGCRQTFATRKRKG